ncbi:MAG: ATP-binding cassette domain-containing protein [Salibacteraceae bacterium]
MNGTNSEKPTPLQRFLKMLVPDKREIRNVYIYAIFNGLISLTLPLGIQAIVNLIQGGQVSASWIVLVIIVVGGVALGGVLQIMQLRIVEDLQQRIFARAAFEFAYRIPHIKMAQLQRKYAPELMNRFFDIISIQKGLSKILIDFSAAALQVIFGMILLSFYHPFFILFSLILILFLYITFRITANVGLKRSIEESTHKYEVAYWLEELARTAMTFKMGGLSGLPLARTNDRVTRYLRSRENHFSVIVGQLSLMVVFKVLVVTGLLAIGGILVMEQLMNIGQFVAAEIIILLIITSVEKLMLSIETIYDVLTGLEKIGEVTDLELEDDRGQDLEPYCTKEGLGFSLDEVTFAYPGTRLPAIKDINLKVNPGEIVMITGSNISGKSTLLHIISGVYDLQDGTMTYQGFPKENLSNQSIRNLIGDCLSHEQLFEGSILLNITLDRPGIDIGKVQEVSKAIGLDDLIVKMPLGYNTQLEPMGRNLPRSIAQLIRIARSTVHNPKLLLIEDPFEHLDANYRQRVIDYLCNKQRGWTLVVVSSEESFARMADRIVVMQDGQIVKTASYQELKSEVGFNQYRTNA